MNQAEFQALLDRQIKGDIHHIVVGVQSRDGRVDLAGAAGMADPQTGAKMQVDTPYAIASITKMYTAAVILQLHEQGLLDLGERIVHYLPSDMLEGIHVYKDVDYGHQIKVYQLVNQTSGLADYEMDRPKGGQSVIEQLKQGHDFSLDTPQILAMVRKLSPHFEPGAANEGKAHYSNTNYRLLGEIIEAVTGRSVFENFEQRIFAPLDLRCTSLYPVDLAASSKRPAAIFLKDQVAVIPKYLSSNIPDGGIVSTVGDNLTFLRAFFEGRLFDASFLKRMTARWNSIFFPMQYGYGMMRVNLPRIFSPLRPFPEYMGHSGSTGSFAYYCPDKALYVAGTVDQIAAPSKPIRLMMQVANAVG